MGYTAGVTRKMEPCTRAHKYMCVRVCVCVCACMSMESMGEGEHCGSHLRDGALCMLTDTNARMHTGALGDHGDGVHHWHHPQDRMESSAQAYALAHAQGHAPGALGESREHLHHSCTTVELGGSSCVCRRASMCELTYTQHVRSGTHSHSSRSQTFRMRRPPLPSKLTRAELTLAWSGRWMTMSLLSGMTSGLQAHIMPCDMDHDPMWMACHMTRLPREG